MELNSTPILSSRFTSTRLVKTESNRRWRSIRLRKRTGDFMNAKQITSTQWTDVDSALISLLTFTKLFLFLPTYYIESSRHIFDDHISILLCFCLFGANIPVALSFMVFNTNTTSQNNKSICPEHNSSD